MTKKKAHLLLNISDEIKKKGVGMFKKIQVFMLATMFLFGCNSEGAFNNEGTDGGLKKELVSIQVTPTMKINGTDENVLIVGLKLSFRALGIYSDGTSKEIGSQVLWKSSNRLAGEMSNQTLSGSNEGKTQISASRDGIFSNKVDVSFVIALLESIQVTPTDATIAKGNTTQLIAKGSYSGGLSADITSSVVWTASNSASVTIESTGLAIGNKKGSSTVVATKNAITSNTVNLTVVDPGLISIQVTPAAPTIAPGEAVQLTAQGIYSDKSSANITTSVEWGSSDKTKASVVAGNATGITEGMVAITAWKNAINSTPVTLTVKNAILTEIQVTPKTATMVAGGTSQFTARGIYSDKTSTDITSSVTWISSDTSSLTITPSGLGSGVAPGTASVIASKKKVDSKPSIVTVTDSPLVSIQVTSSVSSLPKGSEVQLIAEGTYLDGTSVDISSSVTWNSSDTSSLTVTLSGLASGVMEGVASVSATKNSINSKAVNITVTAEELISIQVTPVAPTIGKGNTAQLSALAVFSDKSSSDITAKATWTSDDTTKVSVTPAGKIEGIAIGSAAVTASLGSIDSNEAYVSVSKAVIVKIGIIPNILILSTGSSTQLESVGTYSDGSTGDIGSIVEYSSSFAPSEASLSGAGYFSPIKAGRGGIGLSTGTISTANSALAIAVTEKNIYIQSSPPFGLDVGNTVQLTAQGRGINGELIDISQTVTWRSSTPKVATITSSGTIEALSVGGFHLYLTKDSVEYSLRSVYVN